MYFQTRSQFSQTDVEFIADTIGSTTKEKADIVNISSDPFVLTELLHDNRLFERAMTKPPTFLTISHSLFFYLVVNRVLVDKHLAQDDMVDYVAGVCVEFRQTDALLPFMANRDEKTVYIVDLMNLMNDLDAAQQYYLHRYIGNVTLFLTGFFPEFLYRRCKMRSAPSVAYYEKIGSQEFEAAAWQSSSYDEQAAPVLSLLAERFSDVRAAMNALTHRYLSQRQSHT